MRALLLLLLALSAVAPVAAAEWRAGVARVKITPETSLWMTGYASREHPAEGRAQDLWAKALALDDGAGHRAVLLTADLCAVTRELSDRVAAELGRRFALPRSAVMLNASHTHCAPAIEGAIVAIRRFDEPSRRATADYTRTVEERLVAVAAEALGALRPATLAAGRDTADFAINRRNNPEKDAAALRAAGKLRGPVDHDVPVLAVRATDGALLALVVSYACHNTTLNFYQWHGDYAGCAQAELERRHPGAVALFAQGCAGDQNPFPRREVAYAEQHGRALADAVDRALATGPAPVRGGFSAALDDVTLTFARAPTADEIRAARDSTASTKMMDQPWSDAMAAHGGIRLDYRYPVQAWRLGQLTWIALGGEVVVDYALRLKREAGRDLWVLAYTNDVMAYIPSEVVLAEGGYEGKTSMVPYGRPSAWAPGLEEKIIARARALVIAVAEKK